MDETRFRALMHAAIGDQAMQPWLPTAVRGRLAEPKQRRVPGTVAAVATILVAALVVAGLVIPQLLANTHVRVSTPTLTPATTPNSKLPVVVDPSNCRLPVTVERGAGPRQKSAVRRTARRAHREGGGKEHRGGWPDQLRPLASGAH